MRFFTIFAVKQFDYLAIQEHLAKYFPEKEDKLVTINKIIDWERLRHLLVKTLNYSDGSKGGRPPFDPVMILNVLFLGSYEGDLSDKKMELMSGYRL